MNELFKEISSAIMLRIPSAEIELLEARYSPRAGKVEYAASAWINEELFSGCGHSILAVVQSIENDIEERKQEIEL